MKYMGSKNKYAKEILPIILKDRKPGQYYVEPFVGGFNLIDKVSGNRIANDSNKYLIELFRAIQQGWIPPESIDEETYNDIKFNKDNYPPYLVGFVGFGCSFGGVFFAGYARGDSNKGHKRNYCLESRSNILNQRIGLQNIVINNLDYRHLIIPENSIIYCDPPYQGTKSYSDKFDNNIFWNWIIELAEGGGHTVFVSEYNAPEEYFECVWSKEVIVNIDNNRKSKREIEKLFIYNPI
ncbi:DNA adenine methylase [Candidatus Dependentiae bacterium]|nr:MAG: DNA adenine methylase [Candidatus Dependentiae bacterium]